MWFVGLMHSDVDVEKHIDVFKCKIKTPYE